MKEIEVSYVEGDIINRNIYLRIPFKEDEVVYIYIEKDGRMWRQVCDDTKKGNPSACDDGIDIGPEDLYDTLVDYLDAE